MPTHRHAVKSSTERSFRGAVSFDQNPAAHGGVTRVERCACGAERLRNVNGKHVESSGWYNPTDGVQASAIWEGA